MKFISESQNMRVCQTLLSVFSVDNISENVLIALKIYKVLGRKCKPQVTDHRKFMVEFAVSLQTLYYTV